MNRTLSSKRIFSLGAYQNIELTDTIVDIPEERVMDEKFIGIVSFLQLLNLERRFNAYLILREHYRNSNPEEAFKLIEDQIAEEKAKLFEYLDTPKGE